MAGAEREPTDVALKVTSGPAAGSIIGIPRSGLYLGRDAKGPGTLEGDPAMSPRHGVIWWDQGQLIVRSFDADNGTFVNGDLILQDTAIGPGAEIGVGQSTLVVVEVGANVGRMPPAGAYADHGGTAVAGGQRADRGGVNVGGPNQGVIATLNQQNEVIVDTAEARMLQARGFARVLVILGFIVALGGFISFAYPIFSSIGSASENQRADAACFQKAKTPEAFDQCAEASNSRPQVPTTPWIPLGVGLIIVGGVLTTAGTFASKGRQGERR
jgi:hypothetical protein